MGVSSSVPERACPRKGQKVGRQAVAAQSIQSTSAQSKSGTVVVVVTRDAVTTPVNDWVIFPVVSYASSVKVPE